MSRYYASVRGGKGEATRQGHERSGIESHTRGWTVGVKVRGYAEGTADEFAIYATSGSSGAVSDRLLGVVTADNDGIPRFIAVIGETDSVLMDADRARIT